MDSTGYDIVLFLHIGFVIVFFSIITVLHFASNGLVSAKSLAVFEAWQKLLRRLSPLSGIAVLVVLVLGFALLGMNRNKDQFSYGSSWVVVSIVALVVLEGLAGMILTPWGRAIRDGLAAATTQAGSDAGAVPSDLRALALQPKIWIVSFVITWGFLGVVFLMVVKPNWLWSVLTLVVAIVLGVAEGQWLLGRARTAAVSA